MERPQRKSNRLAAYSYDSAGAYFLTLCSQGKVAIFGSIVGGGVLDAPRMLLSPRGKIVELQVQSMSAFYPDIRIEKYVIMPNHAHFILAITQGASGASGTPPPTRAHTNQTVPAFISTLKRMTNRTAGTQLWQRGYYDHVIRDQFDYDAIWRYIDENPAKWHTDTFYLSDGEEHP